MSRRLVVSPHADRRLEVARDWLRERPPGEELWVVGASSEAAADLLRSVAAGRGAFGWHRASLAQVAAQRAAAALSERGLVPVGRLAAEAVAARVLHGRADAETPGRLASAGRGPGMTRALAAVSAELRSAGLDAGRIASVDPELALLLQATEDALAEAGLADRPAVEMLAARSLREAGELPSDGPLLLLDLPAPSASQTELLAALIERSPSCLVTLPEGDRRARERFESLLGVSAEVEAEPSATATTPLRALQRHLFREGAPPRQSPHESVQMLSAPGESRECVEIARRIQRAAREGLPFDRMAVLLRAPEAYAPFLVEALRRADVPAHFARGTRRPDPGGRALIALLACAAEGLSARRFAEYLSLGEVPAATDAGDPPPSAPPGERWVPPDEELVGERLTAEREAAPEPADPDADAGPEGAGSLPAPRRWERLLVDAAVIGGLERWQRRLRGLAKELVLKRAAEDDPESPRGEALRRDAEDLERLRAFALPLVAELAALPAEGRWGAWIDALSALATRALREPARVLSVLAELAPMSEVGPVGLREVQLVLTPRLLELATPPVGSRYGKVFVAPTDAVRGLDFDLVFVPGLAEKLFPRKIAEDPILLDAQRRRLDPALETNPERLEGERLALLLAVGAARERVVLSFPRLDIDGARPRVPSFYALEALRAAEGVLPGFDALARRAEQLGDARLGWPAPEAADAAIDAAEYDLARLATLGHDSEASRGTARYLMDANPHLGRALRFRARRWLEAWTVADGLVKPGEAGREALAPHRTSERSFSPTALQNFAACPYKFFLHAVWKLAPRSEPEAIEELDPLQRGSLVHDVQFELFSELRDAGLLPVVPARLAEARAHLDGVLDRVTERYADDLAPAIDRVWRDGVESVRADLREWLRRTSEDASGFVPWRFELAFGLPGRSDADPASSDAPVAIDAGLQLRGSVDLVERSADTRVRVTDHKTGKDRFPPRAVIDGGRALQPVLYALVAEKLFPDARVESGRLFFCTSTGAFSEREVPLDAAARSSAEVLARAVGSALEEPFLPAAPDAGACRWCDYRPICGPYEEQRTGRKWQPPLAELHELRKLP